MKKETVKGKMGRDVDGNTEEEENGGGGGSRRKTRQWK